MWVEWSVIIVVANNDDACPATMGINEHMDACARCSEETSGKAKIKLLSYFGMSHISQDYLVALKT